MATYPMVFLNSVNLTDASASAQYGLAPSMPPRVINMPSIQSVTVPGRDGSLPTPQGAHPSPLFTVAVLVAGVGATRDAKSANVEATIEMLGALVSTPSVTIDYRISATARRLANARVATFDVERFDLTWATVTIALELLHPFWWDTGTLTEASYPVVSSGIFINESAYVGTAPILDGQVAIKGPATNPRLTDRGSGDWWSYTGSVGSSERLVFDSKTITARLGPASSTTFTGGGSAVNGAIRIGGNGAFSPSAFRLTPYPPITGAMPDDWRIALVLSGGGTSSATRVEVKARKAFR